MQLSKYLPALQWLRTYNRSDLGGDVGAGLTVAVMLVPQAMAYAMLAGLPPVIGLYASTVPLLLYALFGTSRQLAVGPVAMVSLLVLTGVSPLAAPGSAEYVGYALTLMMMVGVMQLGLGLLRAGFVVNFLSHPVVSGFTSAAALIIGSSQLKHLMGIDIPRSSKVHETVGNVVSHIGDTHLATLAIGAGAIATIVALRRFAPKIPGALVVVVLGTLAVVGLDLAAGGVAIIGNVPGGLPSITAPSLSGDALSVLLPTALAISLVGFMESVSVARFFARQHSYRIEPNQELIGLGMANIGGAFFGGYPVTGGLSRTAVNDQAGARTGLASILTAALIVLTLLFLTPLFHSLPKAVLAAIIMVAVSKLFDVGEVKHLWKTDRVDLGLLVVTFAATLLLGIEEGILLGVAASMLVFMVRRTQPHYAVLGRLPGEGVWRNVENFPEAQPIPGLLALRFDASFYFGNVRFLQQRIEAEEGRSAEPLAGIILDMAAVNALDSSAATMLVDLARELDERDIRLLLASVKGPVRATIARNHDLHAWFAERQYLTCDQAARTFERSGEESEESRHAA